MKKEVPLADDPRGGKRGRTERTKSIGWDVKPQFLLCLARSAGPQPLWTSFAHFDKTGGNLP